ncbi:MAG: dCTP deaminase [Dehalococcoidia bacterium]|jgi:dCTP deaminase|nr:dCTP deaminase [Chloroflexota bacterium]MCK4243121.1 dCTP deaminase [Dehalococcoidia bacterium]
MVLSDRTIKEEIAKGRIIIEPLDLTCIQPASVDIHLGKKLVVFKPWVSPHYIDIRMSLDGLAEEREIPENDSFSLQPGEFVLGSTMEYIGVPDDMMARLEGKSSLGRIGLLIHATAGYVDPGWRGYLTLELCNVSRLPILLYNGMKISQISFHRLTTPAEKPYGSPGLGSKYQDQAGPVFTRYYQEYQHIPLMSVQSIPVKEKATQSNPDATALRAWLNMSEFQGSIRRFAKAIEVPLKTAEDWFYRGAEPSEPNKLRIFQLTQLPQFRPKGGIEKNLPLLEERGATPSS